eukprot:Skav206230  [mRNA]  locus=scaffold3776:101917:103098:+ [translate_table: standard]
MKNQSINLPSNQATIQARDEHPGPCLSQVANEVHFYEGTGQDLPPGTEVNFTLQVLPDGSAQVGSSLSHG